MHTHHHDRSSGGHDPRVFDEAFWNARYSERKRIWSGRPNPQLVAEVGHLRPGTGLDVGCGEGADALWLAARGWQVTGVDISTVALERAAAHEAAVSAEHDGGIPPVRWEHRDLTKIDPPAGSFDLVTAQYMHLPTAERVPLFRALARAVAPGGTLLIVGHHPSDLQSGAQRPAAPDVYFTAEDIAALLDSDNDGGWDHQVLETRPREASGPDGAKLAVADAVYRGLRRS